MNPYRKSLDKSWGTGFRVGQWVRFTYNNSTKTGIGTITNNPTIRPSHVYYIKRLGGGPITAFYDYQLEHLTREEVAVAVAKLALGVDA